MTRPKLPDGLPTPTWQDKEYGIALYRGDCLDVMPGLPLGVVDLTVTSPPYDNLRTYEDSLIWNEGVWRSVIFNLFHATKEGGVVVWVVGDATINGSETGTSFKQALYAMECGFNLHDTMIYQSDKPPLNSNRYQHCFEYMFVFSKGKPSTFIPIKVRSLNAGQKRTSTFYNTDGSKKDVHTKGVVSDVKIEHNIWHFATGNNGDDDIAMNHPARFPEQLANDHIISWSCGRNIVFDPFLGSGTTGKTAVLNDRAFIGIEREPKYFDIAVERISQAIIDKQDGPLFATHVPGQEELNLD